MNPQYVTAGQPNLQHQFNQHPNNNPPPPLQGYGTPSALHNNGPQNANIPQFHNGPSIPPTSQQPDLAQKIQGLSINPTFTNGQHPSPPQNANSHGLPPPHFQQPPPAQQRPPSQPGPSLPPAAKPPQQQQNARAPPAQFPAPQPGFPPGQPPANLGQGPPSLGPQPNQPPLLNQGPPPQPGLGQHLPTGQQPPMGQPPLLGQQMAQPPQMGLPPLQSQRMQPPMPQSGPTAHANLGPHMAPPLANPPLMPPQPQQPFQPPSFSQPGFGPQQRQGLPPAQPPMQPGMPQAGFPPQGYQAQQPGYPGMPQMPPMPGQQPSYQPQSFQGQPAGYPPPGPGYPGTFPQQQQQAPKRLDPDQMPSPIQVMQDDQNNSEGIFNTAQRGRVPPLVTTDFIVEDQGNASPRFVRSSMYHVPVSSDMMKQTAIPFCLVLSPMADTVGQEIPPPLLDFGMLTGNPSLGPIRCQRCKAYMSPAMKFIDSGRHFRCAFCKANTEVPMEYTQYINTMQQYGRTTAEMGLGTYEVVATKEYCRNNTLPKPPALIFIIDVSYNAVKSGLVSLICNNIKTILASLPTDDSGSQPTRVGFITYSSTVQFYNIKGTLAQPQMLSVGDINDIFVPLLEGFLCTVEESGDIIDSLAEQIPRLFADSRETETILLPAVQAGVEALKAADCSGRLLVFHTTLPSAPAPGRLVNREDRKLLGTDKEKQVLQPSGTAYNELGQTCVGVGASVELFLMNNSYVDSATIGQLARLTGGGVNKYTYFQADLDGKRVLSDICHIVGRRTAYDAVMRVRTSTGVRPTDFYGHFFMSNTTDIELACIDSDKAIAVEIKHDDKLTNEEAVYCQAALLYTHFSGQRRLRIVNLALNVATQLTDVYRSCEMDTIMNFFAKQTVWKYRDWSGGPKGARDAFVARAAKILACYRKDCASPSSAGQLVLPESMKLMPLYINCMLRSDAISGGSDVTCDDRSCSMHHVLTADVPTTVVLFYPRLLPIANIASAPNPRPIRCTMEKMLEDGIYLFENGVNILIWVGARAPPEVVQAMWGVPNMAAIESQVTDVPILENAINEALHDLIDDIRRQRRRCLRVTLVKQRDKLEVVLKHFLVEDRGVDGAPSYVDFLCHMHKEIRALL